MSTAEKSEAEIALETVGHLVASALQSIKHDTDDRLRARLQHQQVDDSPL